MTLKSAGRTFHSSDTFLFTSQMSNSGGSSIVSDTYLPFFYVAFTFCEQIFNLPVYGAKIIFCPGCDLIIQFCREPERDLLLLVCPPPYQYRLPEFTTGCAS